MFAVQRPSTRATTRYSPFHFLKLNLPSLSVITVATKSCLSSVNSETDALGMASPPRPRTRPSRPFSFNGAGISLVLVHIRRPGHRCLLLRAAASPDRKYRAYQYQSSAKVPVSSRSPCRV